MSKLKNSLFTLPIIALLLANSAAADDWPQFLGPERNGISGETGLIDAWPPGGPKEVWRIPGGVGMSGLAIRGERVVTMLQQGGREYIVSFDAKSGREIWKAEIGKEYENRTGGGARATPTIAGSLVYAFTGRGTLISISLEDGSKKWRRDVVTELGGTEAEFGMTSSPLVHGKLVIVTPGAPGATLAAYDNTSGELVWKAGSDRAGYSSPNILSVGKDRQLVAFTGESIIGCDPSTGKVLWRHPFETPYDCNIAMPLSHRGRIFIASGENHGCAFLSVDRNDGAFKASELWKSLGPKSVMRNEWQTSILIGDHLYGFDNVGAAGPVTHLNCVNITTGKRIWQVIRFGKGNLIAADGKLFIMTFKGELVIALPSPEGFKELGRKKYLGRTRQAPSLANGHLFLRDGKEIVCLDVRK